MEANAYLEREKTKQITDLKKMTVITQTRK